ncbi:MAG: hypothetical protein AAF216_06855 [Pseudomonadota bacterium]
MTAPRRVRTCLDTVAYALDLAVEQADTGHWRWVSVALITALQAACVAALSGYPSAEDEDVTVPGDPAQIASLQTLLRRVASTDYLSDPERLKGQGRAVADALELQAFRNQALHVPVDGSPASYAQVEALIPTAIVILRHLILDQPAFDPAPHAQTVSQIEHAIVRLSGGKR